MDIVILDSFSANPGDLSWDEFAALGRLTLYDRTPADLVIERAREAECVLTNKTIITADMMAQLPRLRYIGVLATGVNVVDVAAATARGIVVSNVPSYSTTSVAQATIALLLALTNHAETYSRLNAEGEWSRCDDFCYWHRPLLELAGSTMGIVGFGNIGSHVAAIAMAMGMRVVAFTSKPAEALPAGVEKAPSLDELLANSDVVSLHCPLTPSTHHIINASTLRLMKPTALLLNTARGPLIDEAALAEALRSHAIAGAGLDVLEKEPPAADNPLLGLDNCIVMPHIAWATTQARTRLLQIAADNLRAFLAGKPQNVVS